jgi:hypothetical protein
MEDISQEGKGLGKETSRLDREEKKGDDIKAFDEKLMVGKLACPWEKGLWGPY